MSPDTFSRLSPYIQDYIRRAGWDELRPVQIAASEVLFNTQHHLLLAAGTASGKTEAAFLPILTLLDEAPAASISVLYIGPLKALINDQFERLDHLLEEARIPVHAWHGDVAQSKKSKTLKTPSGVLQITPESMEGMFLYRTNMLHRLFHDLRFIVIDEVHAFMSSDRGRQVLCQLGRLRPYLDQEPRRIGLSATLGDYAQAERWLGSDSSQGVFTPQVEEAKRTVRLSLDHFVLPKPKDSKQPTNQSQDQEPEESEDPEASDEVRQSEERFSQYLWNETTCRNKVLIFANSRSETENCVARLRAMARRRGLPDVFHVHHGNIARPLREEAEEAMKDPARQAVTAATLTLELGIDIGQLDRVLQLGSPHSVSSFLQRLGRSGRRGGAGEMFLSVAEHDSEQSEEWPEQIPWELVQAIAIVQLYVEERWIEPAEEKPLPYSLLYHQTLGILASLGELAPAELAGRVLALSPFEHITKNDYREFLLYLMDLHHIERSDEGGLIVGVEAEPIVNHYTFLAVFSDSQTYSVKDGSREIGSIDGLVPPGERFRLAGRTWQVKDVDDKRKVIYVTGVQGKSTISWQGGAGHIHTKVLQRMRRVLVEANQYQYLQPHGQRRLEEARKLAKEVGIGDTNLLPLANQRYCFLPWIGSRGFNTIRRILALHNCGSPGRSRAPFYMEISIPLAKQEFVRELHSLPTRAMQPTDLIDPKETMELDKYDQFVPKNLLHQAYAYNELDMQEALDCLETVT